jgi:hypothetical protein
VDREGIDADAFGADATGRGTDSRPPGRRSRYIPAFLDALIPGLGHLVAGRPRRAILFLTPLLVALVAGIWIALTTSTPRLVASLLGSEVLWGLIAAQGMFLLWRLLAVGSSLFDPSLPRPERRDILPVALLLVFVLGPQVYAGYATEIARESADAIFVTTSPVAARPSFTPEPDPSFLSTPAPASSASPQASVAPSASPAIPRVTGLIIGVDSGVGRNTYLTDTMIVVSLDPVTQTVSMVSVRATWSTCRCPTVASSAARSTRSFRTRATIRTSSPVRTGPASMS